MCVVINVLKSDLTSSFKWHDTWAKGICNANGFRLATASKNSTMSKFRTVTFQSWSDDLKCFSGKTWVVYVGQINGADEVMEMVVRNKLITWVRLLKFWKLSYSK